MGGDGAERAGVRAARVRVGRRGLVEVGWRWRFMSLEGFDCFSLLFTEVSGRFRACC